MAAAHGTIAGLTSAFIAVGIQILGLSPEHGLGGAIGLIFAEPQSTLLFLFGGFLVGEIHDAHARRFHNATAELEAAQRDARRLSYERETLLTALHRLKKRIEEQPVHLANLIESSAKLQQGPSDDLYPMLLDLVNKNCGASKASVWLVDAQGRLGLAAERGWVQGERLDRIAHYAQSDLIAFAIRMRCEIKAFEFGSRVQPGDPLFVAPLEAPDGSLHGLLVVDEIPSRLVSPGAAAVFFGIAEWASTTLAVKGWGSQADDAVGLRPVRGEADLSERLRVEFDRTTRYGTPLSVAIVQVAGWRYRSTAARDELERALVHELSPVLEDRELYRFGHPGCYVLVMSGVDAGYDGADLKLEGETRPDTTLRIESRLLGVDSEAPDLHSFIERMDAHFREHAAQPFEDDVPLLVPPLGELGDLDGLLRRLRVEARVAQETGAPCHLAIFHGVSPDGGRPWPTGARQALEQLRPSDGLYWFDPDSLVLLMPNTDRDSADVAAARVLAVLRDAGGPELSLIPEPQIVACEAEGLAPLTLLQLVEADE
ncbi:MAG: hypothetical protein QNJ98_03405 [Planctomycetota bacterium]|nr:hypothetical protein [Planctomycetota bacterium]